MMVLVKDSTDRFNSHIRFRFFTFPLIGEWVGRDTGPSRIGGEIVRN